VNRARVRVEHNGQTLEEREIPLDPRDLRRTQGPEATIGFTVGRSLEYGALKVSAHVTLSCDQDRATLDAAAAAALRLAIDYATEGMRLLAQGGGPT
jgi:hypothetical protein